MFEPLKFDCMRKKLSGSKYIIWCEHYESGTIKSLYLLNHDVQGTVCRWNIKAIAFTEAGLGGSVGYAANKRSGGYGFHPFWVSNILSWRLFMKYFHFLPSADSKRAFVSFLAKECAQYWLTA